MGSDNRQRIDKWLFFARVVKSRSLAAKLAQAGRVRVNRDKAEQASHPVKPGDVLTITLDRRVLVYRVVDCGTRRGPAEEARTLYEDISPEPAPRNRSPPEEIVPLRDTSSERPTKKERRAIDPLRDLRDDD
jgi:ribosome-associated heat shock protein Hsp15